MIHVGALPATPKYEGSLDKIVSEACQEAEVYKSCCVDTIMLENMHDVPYVRAKDFQLCSLSYDKSRQRSEKSCRQRDSLRDPGFGGR